MQIPLQITFHDFPRSEVLEARIRDKAASLERFHPRITRCRVTVAGPDRRHHKGRQFEVHVDVRVPGHGEVVATRNHDEDVHIALRDAFDAATRQLEDLVREKRGDVKAHEPTQQGTVARLLVDEGYGFIATSDGRELYFSRENVMHPPFEHLAPGMTVNFIESSNGTGQQANRVSSGKQPMPMR